MYVIHGHKAVVFRPSSLEPWVISSYCGLAYDAKHRNRRVQANHFGCYRRETRWHSKQPIQAHKQSTREGKAFRKFSDPCWFSFGGNTWGLSTTNNNMTCKSITNSTEAVTTNPEQDRPMLNMSVRRQKIEVPNGFDSRSLCECSSLSRASGCAVTHSTNGVDHLHISGSKVSCTHLCVPTPKAEWLS